MDQVSFFKCLADETRLSIVTLVTENKELCVCDLTEKLQLSQPKISRHLALLRVVKGSGFTTVFRLNYLHGVTRY